MSHNKEAANEYLTRFARLMRLFLESSRENFISLSQEIDMLRLYTDLEQMRFRDKFEAKIEVAEGLDLNQDVPSMLLQPFVENAINHGLIYLKEKGLLTLSFENDEAENLIIKIDDNGVGRKTAAIFKSNRTGSYKSRAMEIVQQRIDTINESKEGNITLEIVDKTDLDGNAAGTCVVIIIKPA